MQRLRKRSEFVAAARGRRFHTERMSVQGLVATEPGCERGLRLGLTLTKKVGHATERNRIRRRLRAVAEVVTPDFAARPVDIVVVGRREAISAPFPVLVEDLTRALCVVTKPRAPKPAGALTTTRPAARSPSERGDHA